MRERKIRAQFPRTPDLPAQSSKYWAKEKDRLLRQLLLSDIEEETGRELVVYFSRLDQAITETDADDLSEVLQGTESKDIDILVHTPGGLVDAVEKFVSILQLLELSYRVIVPSVAKSGGTLIALSAQRILMGANSELGPVDPQMTTPDYRSVPAEYVAADDTQQPILRAIAKANAERGKNLADRYLRAIFAPRSETPTKAEQEECRRRIDEVNSKLCSPTGYGSHGAVIDYAEAHALGLPVDWLAPETSLWRRLWLLHCLYDFDTKQGNIGKIFEGARYSISRPPLVWD
jgi:hypothetical protein